MSIINCLDWEPPTLSKYLNEFFGAHDGDMVAIVWFTNSLNSLQKLSFSSGIPLENTDFAFSKIADRRAKASIEQRHSE